MIDFINRKIMLTKSNISTNNNTRYDDIDSSLYT